MAFKLGEMFVRIVAKKGSVDADIDQTKTKLEEAGNKGQESGEKIGRGFTQAGDAATRFQGIVSKILIPAGIVSAIAGVVSQIKAAIDSAREFERTLDDIGKRADEQFRAIRTRNLDALTAEIQALKDQSLAEQNAIEEAATAKVNGLYNVIAEAANLLDRTDAFGETTSEAIRRAADAEATGVSDTYGDAISTLRAQYRDELVRRIDEEAEILRRARLTERERAIEDEKETARLVSEARKQEGLTEEQNDALARAEQEARIRVETETRLMQERKDAEDARERERAAAEQARQDEIDRREAERLARELAAKEKADQRAAEMLEKAIKNALDEQQGSFAGLSTGIARLEQEFRLLRMEGLR